MENSGPSSLPTSKNLPLRVPIAIEAASAAKKRRAHRWRYTGTRTGTVRTPEYTCEGCNRVVDDYHGQPNDCPWIYLVEVTAAKHQLNATADDLKKTKQTIRDVRWGKGDHKGNRDEVLNQLRRRREVLRAEVRNRQMQYEILLFEYARQLSRENRRDCPEILRDIKDQMRGKKK